MFSSLSSIRGDSKLILEEYLEDEVETIIKTLKSISDNSEEKYLPLSAIDVTKYSSLRQKSLQAGIKVEVYDDRFFDALCTATAKVTGKNYRECSTELIDLLKKKGCL